MIALICYEAGKTWSEADADTAETIDFLEFYGREMLRLAGPQQVVPMKGEKNYLVYIPLGVGVVIPPWNFPAAIAAGMSHGLARHRKHRRSQAAGRNADSSLQNLSRSLTKPASQRMRSTF